MKDTTGLEIMRVLGDEMRNEEIDVLEFSPAVESLMDDQGQCGGAVLLNFDTQHCLSLSDDSEGCKIAIMIQEQMQFDRFLGLVKLGPVKQSHRQIKQVFNHED